MARKRALHLHQARGPRWLPTAASPPRPARPAPRADIKQVLPGHAPPPAATRVPMARPAMLVGAALALCLLLAPPCLAWYKQAAGPGYYSVGRAAGLLSGFRRSPYTRRSESPVGTGPLSRAGAFPDLRPSLRSLVSTGRWRVRGRGGCGAPPHPPPAPRPCASRTSLPTCRAASGSPTAESPSSARRMSSCPSAPRTVAAREPRPEPGPAWAPGVRSWRPVPSPVFSVNGLKNKRLAASRGRGRGGGAPAPREGRGQVPADFQAPALLAWRPRQQPALQVHVPQNRPLPPPHLPASATGSWVPLGGAVWVPSSHPVHSNALLCVDASPAVYRHQEALLP